MNQYHLLAQLQTAVPDLTTEQYTAALTSAVGAFNRKAGMSNVVQLDVTAGQMSYDLPADFLKLIRIDGLFGPGQVISQPGGLLVPLSNDYEPPKPLIRGRTAVFYPVPTIAARYGLVYKAGHILDDNDDYSLMGDEEAAIILVKATANCLRMVSGQTAGDGWKYSIGDVMVDKSGQGKSLGEAAGGLDAEFDKLMSDYVGAVGRQAAYSVGERALYFDLYNEVK